MTDDREPFREARAAGLKARHEQRLENATYTAAEVKVLTEAALRLGRKEALDEVEAALNAALTEVPPGSLGAASYKLALKVIRDATSGRTDPGMDSDLPQDSQAGREPVDDLVGALRKAVEAAKARRQAGDPS